MPPAARVTDMHTCPMVTGVVPHVGGPILPPGCPTVLIGMMPAARVGDMATCVGPPDVIAKGSPTVLIGNMMAARLGDNTAHGGIIVIGYPTVIIGESGGPGSALSKALSHLGSELGKGFSEAIKPEEILKDVIGSSLDFVKFLAENPATVRGATNLIKAAGSSANVSAVAKNISEGLKGLDSIKGATVAGGIISPVVEFASRCIEGKPLFTSAAIFDYGTSAVEGAISGAIAGAIVGSVVPGPGTVVGFVAGLAIGIGVAIGVHTVAKPAEDRLKKEWGINEDD